MLLSRHAGERLEPMGVMGCPPLNRPILHGVCHHVSYAGIQLCAVFDGLLQFFVHVLGQTVLHHRIIEYVLTKHLRYIQYFAHRFIHPLFLIFLIHFHHPDIVIYPYHVILLGFGGYITKRCSPFEREHLCSLLK